MTDVLNKIAQRVVIRHTCNCKYAIAKPVYEAEQHVFTVDGEDFPWYITERGQIVKRIRDDLYLIDIEIIGLDKKTVHTIAIEYLIEDSPAPCIPVIGGREFPWLLSEHPMTLTFGHKMFPILHLAFFAREVDANIEVQDLRDEQLPVYCAGGYLIAPGKYDDMDVST
jgi:hypothetical protein